jgi:hypothetical protein
MTETSDVVRPTLEALNGIPGVVAYRIHAGKAKVRGGWMHLGERGIPDIGCCVRGLSVFFEAKAAKGLVSEEQLAWHGKARRAGAMVFVIRSPGAAVEVVRKVLANQLEVVA